MDSLTSAQCPFCGETIELVLDPGGGDTQTYIEDCEVCCRPMQVNVVYARDGRARARIVRAD
jgi:hypothetical protein